MFIEPEHSLIDLAAASYGVLSQILGQHPQDRSAADPPTLNQADHHPHVLDYRRFGLDRRRLAHRDFARVSLPPALGRSGTSALVEVGLLSFTIGVTVIGGTALGGLLFAVSLPAAEGTPQVVAPRIPWVGQEENAAVPAPGPADAQVGLGSLHRSQQPVILQYQGGYRAQAIPVGLELKMVRDPNCKKPKLWLRILT
jgi:hypothetical protein